MTRADPDQRAAFVEQLNPLLVATTRGQHTLVYIDEAHFRQDTDEGYGWSIWESVLDQLQFPAAAVEGVV